jgi:CheY-like chemotaxis protein
MIGEYTILCVDDDKENLELLKAILEEEGYNLILASSGSEALKELRAKIPDLILLDVIMPDMTGIEVLKKIRSDNKMCDIPVVMLTASHELHYIKEAVETGAVSYIRKPFTHTVLLGVVKGFLGNR